MTEHNENTSAPAAKAAKGKQKYDRILIRPWPKVVFFWPTLVISLVAWFISVVFIKDAATSGSPTLGLIFSLVFFANLLVFAFDFSRIKSITILFILVALAFGLMWANQAYGIMEPIQNMLEGVQIRMNTQFYGFTTCFFCFIFLLVFINSRFNYYEVNRNEILHHHGYLGDIQRTPTSAMRMQKEIYDLMEYLLLRSGRLIFYPATTREAVVIDNVMNVNIVEERIKELLSSVSVAIDTDPHSVGVMENPGQL